jgi:hypothetical protein
MAVSAWWRTRVTRLPPAASLVLFVLVPLIGLALTVVSDNVPDRLVMESLVEATEEGSLDAAQYDTGLVGHRVDRFTECVAITVGLGDEPGTGTVASAIRAPTLGPCDRAIPKIVGWAEGDGLVRSYDYFRYWHGHTVVLRPLIAVFGVAATRLVAVAALAAAVLFLGRRVRDRVGAAGAIAALAPMLVSTDFIDLPSALPHAVSMVVMFVTAAIVIGRGVAGPHAMAVVGALAGAAFVYVDILLNPDAAFTLFVTATALASLGAVSLEASVKRMIAAAVGWVVGYASMWLSKWMIASMLLGVDRVRSDVTDQVDLRLQGEHAGLELGWFGGIERTLREWWSQPFTWLVLGASVAWVATAVSRRWRAGEPGAWSGRLVLAAPAIVAPVWFTVMRNHTQVHAFFTYRSWAVALGVVVLAFVVPSRFLVRESGDGRRALVSSSAHR